MSAGVDLPVAMSLYDAVWTVAAERASDSRPAAVWLPLVDWKDFEAARPSRLRSAS